MMRKTTWTLLLAVAGMAVTGSAVAQLNVPLDGESFCFNQGSGLDGLVAVNDLHTSVTTTEQQWQDVSVDDDTVLLAIALANNGANGITWNKVRSFEAMQTERVRASQTANLDREDVFSALALGIHDNGSSLEALACVSDIESSAEITTRASQDISLDEDNVLLAIALSNSIGGSLEFDDIASYDKKVETEFTQDREVDVERSDTFLALALGNGGR